MCKMRLDEGIAFWQSLPRNNHEELAVADGFFDQELMPLSLELFLEKQASKVKQDYYGMMLTLGTSWQPLALSIALLKPKKILVMCTQDTYPLLEILLSFLHLDRNNVQCAFVDRSSSEDIYLEMKAAYLDWSDKGKLCADITGGTKAMASSAAMMAAVLGMDIYYVESRYLPLYRRPLPGSEELKVLGNPLEFNCR